MLRRRKILFLLMAPLALAVSVCVQLLLWRASLTEFDWTTDFDGSPRSLVVDEQTGRIFLLAEHNSWSGTANQNGFDFLLHCVDADGKPLWQQMLHVAQAGVESRALLEPELLLQDGSVQICLSTGERRSYDLDGNMLWEQEVPGECSLPPAITSSGRIALINRNREILLYDSQGKLHRQHLSDEGFDKLAFGPAGEVLGISKLIDPEISRFRPIGSRLSMFSDHGEPLWTHELEGYAGSDLACDSDFRIYILIESKVYCLDGFTGSELWSLELDPPRPDSLFPSLYGTGVVIDGLGRLVVMYNGALFCIGD